MYQAPIARHTALQSGLARLSPTTNFETSCLMR